MRTLTCSIEKSNFEDIKEFKTMIFKSAFAVLNPCINEDEKKEIINFLPQITEQSRLHPLLFQIAAGKKTIANINPYEREQICKMFSVESSSSKVEYLTYDEPDLNKKNILDWSNYFVEFQRRHRSITNSAPPKFNYGNDTSETAIKHLEDSLVHLKIAWPEMRQLTDCLLTHICFLKSDYFESGCMMGSFGAVYLSPSDYWTFDYFIEVLVHEVSHLQMMIYEKNYSFVINTGEISDSPLRKDLRPMLGVLHAVLALVRMAEVALRLTKHPHPNQQKAVESFELNIKRLKGGIEILKTRAQLTEHGKILLSSIESRKEILLSAFQK